MKKLGAVIFLSIFMGGFLCWCGQGGKTVFAAAAVNKQNDVSLSKEESVMLLLSDAPYKPPEGIPDYTPDPNKPAPEDNFYTKPGKFEINSLGLKSLFITEKRIMLIREGQ